MVNLSLKIRKTSTKFLGTFSLEECAEDQAFWLAFPALKTSKENRTLSANRRKRTTIPETLDVKGHKIDDDRP